MLRRFPRSRAKIAVLVDLCKGVMPAAVSAMDTSSDWVIMLLAGGVIGPLTGTAVGGLADEMGRNCVGMLTEVFMPGIGVSAGVSANMWVILMSVLDFIALPSSEELLLFCWTTFRCWLITVFGCRALQT